MGRLKILIQTVASISQNYLDIYSVVSKF